jgi:hypothetical protein
MTAPRLLLPRSQTVGGDGRPLVGAKLYTYETGTSTPKPVYSDAALSIPLDNPVETDNAGRFPAMFMAVGDYKTILTDANDAVIATDDPVDGKPAVPDPNIYFKGNMQRFITTGNFTVPAEVTRIKVTVTAGGGSGASCAANSAGGGGGAGGTAIESIAVTPGDVIAVTIGLGGAAPASGANNGAPGGTSSFGAFCSATGGVGGTTAGAGGQGAAATGGTINIQGGDASDALLGATPRGGDGGGSYWGGGGRGGASATGGVAGQAYGAGGGGAYDNIGTPAPGGAGAPGVVVVEW